MPGIYGITPRGPRYADLLRLYTCCLLTAVRRLNLNTSSRCGNRRAHSKCRRSGNFAPRELALPISGLYSLPTQHDLPRIIHPFGMGPWASLNLSAERTILRLPATELTMSVLVLLLYISLFRRPSEYLVIGRSVSRNPVSHGKIIILSFEVQISRGVKLSS